MYTFGEGFTNQEIETWGFGGGLMFVSILVGQLSGDTPYVVQESIYYLFLCKKLRKYKVFISYFETILINKYSSILSPIYSFLQHNIAKIMVIEHILSLIKYSN